jgi:phytoene desaturase
VRSAREKKIVVVGGGLGGRAPAALLGRAGHEVTLLEASSEVGGKSRRIVVGGQRMDTGPSLVTFPGVWQELLRRWDALGNGGGSAGEVAGLRLGRLEEVGRYYYRGNICSLPVEEGHPWRAAWERFEAIHGGLGPEVTSLLTADPLDRGTLPALLRLLRVYGAKLTTRGYLDGLGWLPEGLREVIAIHTLNAGVGPSRTPALYASMPAIMARDGVWVPEGGVYEIPRALERLARAAGVEIKTGEPVAVISKRRVPTVLTENDEYRADAIVSGLDAEVLREKLAPHRNKPRKSKLSCSGVAIYAALKEELPEDVATHGVVLPTDPQALYRSLEAGEEPEETMAFVNYYRPGEVYPNDGGTLALLLTAPPNGREYGLESPFVERELERLGRELSLPRPITEYLGEHEILHPRYFEGRGAPGGALYGVVRPFWRSGPFHNPRYNDRRRPWLWRVGASVHPGGGIPAVLGGAMISTSRLLRSFQG